MDAPLLPPPGPGGPAAPGGSSEIVSSEIVFGGLDPLAGAQPEPRLAAGAALSDGLGARRPSPRSLPGRDGGWVELVEQMGEAELRGLVASMPAIEQAKGMLMAYYGCDAERAFAILRRWSSVHHVKVRDLADLLVEHAPVDPPTRAAVPGSDKQWRPFDPVRTFLTQTNLDVHPR